MYEIGDIIEFKKNGQLQRAKVVKVCLEEQFVRNRNHNNNITYITQKNNNFEYVSLDEMSRKG